MLTNKTASILILLSCCFGARLLGGEPLSVKAQPASNSVQQTERKRPLTFKQIESLIKGSSTARPTPDNIIADEITERSVDFRLDDQMLARLEEMGAGALTLNALRSLRGRVSKPGTTIVLLADFKGLEPYGEDIGLTDILSGKLNEAIANYPDVKVVTLGNFITASHGGKQAALDAGREQNASIVLWGWFLRSSEKILVTVNFEVMRSPHSVTISSERGDYKAALSTLNEFTLQGYLSDELTTIILAATALTRMDVGDYWGATSRFNEAMSRHVSPQMVMGYDDILVQSSWAYLQATIRDGPESVKKYIPQVVKNLEQFTSSHKDHIPAFQALGLAHILVGEYDKALSDGRRLLEIESSEPLFKAAAYQILFYAAISKGDEKLEKEYANNILKFAEGLDLPSAFEELRADAYLFLGDNSHALESYDRALKRNASTEAQIRIHNAKASIYYDKNETWDQALNELRQVIQLDPDDAKAYNLTGNIFYGRGKFQEAVTYYQAAVNRDSRNSAYYNNLGNAYDALNDEKRAKDNYTRALEIDPKNARAYFDRGSMLYKLGNEKDALSDLDKSLTLEPEYLDALYKRAYIHLNASNFDAASADYERIVKIASKDPDAFNLKGDISYWKKEYAAAVDAYSKAISLNPHNAMYYDNRGNTYTQVGKTIEALEDYKRAITEDPKYANAYLDEGRLFYQLGQVKEALDTLEKCFAVDPTFVDPLYERANIFSRNKNYDAAIAEYKRIIESYPKDATAFYYRGEVQAFKGNFFEAFADYGRAIKLQPDYAEVYLTRGLLYIARGNRKAGIADFRKVLEISKDQNFRQQAEQQIKQLSSK